MMSTDNATDYLKYNHLAQEEVFASLVSKLGIKPGFRCLDIGCGPGDFTKRLVDFVGKDGYVLGVDPDENRINVAKEAYSLVPNLDFMCINAGNMPTDLQKFDVASSSFVLHWMKNEEKWKTLENVFNLLKTGGTFSFRCLLNQPELNKRIYSFVEDKEKIAHVLNMEFPTLNEYKQKLTENMYDIVEIQATEHTVVYQTANQLLYSLKASINCKVDFVQLYDKYKDHLQFEQNEDGEYIKNLQLINVVAKKPNKT